MTNSAIDLTLTRPASQQDGTYPRPLAVRDNYLLLDRGVAFAYDDELVGLDEGWFRTDEPFDRTIQLPFPPESELSGIDDPSYHPCVWYRIELTADDLATAGHSDRRRLILHFGAVDHEATVFVDGQQIGSHLGGQVPFSFDITAALDPAQDTHVVTLRAYDDPHNTRQPRGKQDWEPEPHIIWYRRSTGIWRTVWLESVPTLHVSRVVWRSDVDNRCVEAHVELNRRPKEPVTIDLAVAFEGTVFGAVSCLVNDQVSRLTVDLATANNYQTYESAMWTPREPRLLDAGVVVHGPDGDDEVRSYLGLRSVGATNGVQTLNTHPFYVRSVLEQGYWRESCFTPPSVDAMRAEVELILSLGFNHARLHQKTEDPRFLFFCDKLGLTLSGEAANGYPFDQVAASIFTHEWAEIVRAYEGHPSIIMWTPINESWGVMDVARSTAQASYTTSIAELTRALDPTRPVVSNDGWEHTDSDLMTIHDYEPRREVLAERYTPEGLDLMYRTVASNGHPIIVGDKQKMLPVVLVTEFGGVRYVPDEGGDTWGHSTARDEEDLAYRIREIVEPIRASNLIRGFCWTQLTDTLQEANGLCYDDRTPKLPVEELRSIFGE